jgi:hypothetical protein
MYGALLDRHGRASDARRALKHALWLRRTSGDRARARSTERLLDHVRDAA